MVSPKEEKNAIYKRLSELEKIINPKNDTFMFDMTHPLCPERDGLIETFHQYSAYGRWFENRHPSIIVGSYISGATAIQNRIHNMVVFNATK